MEVNLLLVADYASVDAGGKLNVIGSFTRITFAKLPGQHPSMSLVVRLMAHFGEFEQQKLLKILLVDEDGNEIFKIPNLAFKIPSPENGKLGEHIAVINIQYLTFQNAGRHEFRVYVNDDFKESVSIDIVVNEKLLRT